MNFSNKIVIIIGGSSGIGFSVAQMIIENGGKVILGGRSQEKLAIAVKKLGASAESYQVDNTDKLSIKNFFDQISSFDHLFTPGASYTYGPIDQISDESAESPFRSKFWGQYWATKFALSKINKSGSIVLMSGAASVRPAKYTAAYAAANAAIEGLGRALALELSPIRVNTISPGTVDSDLWQNRPAKNREEAFNGFSAVNITGRVASVEEIADSVCFLMKNTNITGNTLFADGGYALR